MAQAPLRGDKQWNFHAGAAQTPYFAEYAGEIVDRFVVYGQYNIARLDSCQVSGTVRVQRW